LQPMDQVLILSCPFPRSLLIEAVQRDQERDNG
jgi:hypothetical protein